MPKEWLQLIRIKGLPLAVKRRLVVALGSPGAVLAADAGRVAEILRATGRRQAKLCAVLSEAAKRRPNVDDDLARMARADAHFIGFDDADFPPLLNQIGGAPLGLFIRGDRALLASPQLAMVGSRAPSPSGRRTTEKFAAELATLGFTITSGLAVGIDSSAHRGCLAAGGKTIAVMATGIDSTYPRDNLSLGEEIAATGLLVSEYLPGAPPKREYFPRRNRIISGLSLGTLVVEAGIRSGSLITARLAGEQGREVFAVPGSIYAPTSRGCHQLLRQGAKLVESSADITEEISQFFTVPNRPTMAPGTAPTAAPKSALVTAALRGEAARLYALIDYAATDIDQLIERSGLTADQVSYILLRLEVDGLIVADGDGYLRLPP